MESFYEERVVHWVPFAAPDSTHHRAPEHDFAAYAKAYLLSCSCSSKARSSFRASALGVLLPPALRSFPVFALLQCLRGWKLEVPRGGNSGAKLHGEIAQLVEQAVLSEDVAYPAHYKCWRAAKLQTSSLTRQGKQSAAAPSPLLERIEDVPGPFVPARNLRMKRSEA